MTVGLYLLNKNYYYNFFQIKQKTVQTLLKWLFWTSINLDIINKKYYFSWSICINTVCLLPHAGGPFTFTFTFTFSHLADAFIQSDLQLGNT